MMELDPSGALHAELWRMWSQYEWREGAPAARDFMEVLRSLEHGAVGFEPSGVLANGQMASLTADALEYVVEHELIPL